MIKIIKSLHIFSACIILLSSSSFADGFITKKVYSFKANNGTPVFTDKRPGKKQNYKTQTIEASDSTAREDRVSNYNSTARPIYISQTQTVIVSSKMTKHKSSKAKKKHNAKRCKHYKEKYTYYSERMRAGYRSSEYKKLEKKRKKYRKLLFNKCETKTFRD